MTISSYGENAFAPGMSSETFVPDQLIAGSLRLVTQPILVSGNAALVRGTVLGQLSSNSIFATAGADNTGDGTAGTLSTGTGALLGDYVLTATSATNWTVTNPEGVAMANATTGTAYAASGIGVTVVSGSAAFVAGDSFTLTVVDAIGTFVKSVSGASDGSQTPCAILVDYADPTNGPVRTGAYVLGEFNAAAVTYDSSWTPELLATALRPYAIFLKSSVSATDSGTAVTNFA